MRGEGSAPGAKAAGPACGRGAGTASRMPSGALGSIQWLLDHWKVKLRSDLDKCLVMRSDSGSTWKVDKVGGGPDGEAARACQEVGHGESC